MDENSTDLPLYVTNVYGMKLRFIPAGSFMMGSQKSDVEPIQREYDLGENAFDEESPPYQVTISKSFYMGVYVVTQAQYEAVMGKNPGRYGGENNPVDDVSWYDAVEFCKRLSELTGESYRLPSEAEWEYACRAGITTVYYWGDSEDEMDKYAWYEKNACAEEWTAPHADKEGTQPVGQKESNAWGLHDMLGNAWEWCRDMKGKYPSGAATDPKGPQSGDFRVCRGGSWFSGSWDARSAYRNAADPEGSSGGHGFRVVRDV